MWIIVLMQFVKQISFTDWLALIQPPSFVPDSLGCINCQTGTFYLFLYSWLACPSGNLLNSKPDFKCFSVFPVASSNICCIHTWADLITFPVCHHISLNSGDQHHNYHYFYDTIIMLYRETSTCLLILAQTSEFICNNTPLGWKYGFIYMLLLNSSLVAEELEEKADLKARMAAPPLTPQQTVLFAR